MEGKYKENKHGKTRNLPTFGFYGCLKIKEFYTVKFSIIIYTCTNLLS